MLTLYPELDQHLAKIEELEQTLFELSGEIAGGRHVPPKTRVLCLKENPDQQWVDLRQAAMDRLKSENEALLKRLKDLEDTGVKLEGSEDLVPRESWDQVVREKQDLEGEVKQKEKRLLRLQQVLPLRVIYTAGFTVRFRYSPRRAPNSEKPSPPSSGSSLRFTRTVKCV